MFAGLGHHVIDVKVDSSAAHAFFHRRGVGRMKHTDSRILWLEDLIAAGGVRLKKIPRTLNLADMLTHTPSAKELEVFHPSMGLRCCSERDKELVVTRQYKPSPIKRGMMGCRMSIECESVLAWLRVRVEINWYSSHARHVSMWFGKSSCVARWAQSIGQER